MGINVDVLIRLDGAGGVKFVIVILWLRDNTTLPGFVRLAVTESIPVAVPVGPDSVMDKPGQVLEPANIAVAPVQVAAHEGG